MEPSPIIRLTISITPRFCVIAPMTTTFLLPLAMGACEAAGGNILTDAFGIVAMVAMTPLLTIQLLGLYSKIKKKLAKHQQISIENLEDCIVFFDEE